AAVTTGRVTLTLLFSIGVMTMKMIRSTSITSTIGVTLMFELTFLPSSRFAIDIALNSRRPLEVRLLAILRALYGFRLYDLRPPLLRQPEPHSVYSQAGSLQAPSGAGVLSGATA